MKGFLRSKSICNITRDMKKHKLWCWVKKKKFQNKGHSRCLEKGESARAGVIRKGFTEKVKMSHKLSVHIRNDQIEEAVWSFLAGRRGYQCSQHWVFPGVCKRWEAYPRR